MSEAMGENMSDTDFDNFSEKTIPLPSGKTAVMARPKGRHLRNAGKVAPDAAADQIGFSYALIAAVTQVDGAPIVAEDLDDMDLGDVNALLAAVGEWQAASGRTG